jgi:hypothetical protein
VTQSCTFITFNLDDRNIALYKGEGHHEKWNKSNVVFTERSYVIRIRLVYPVHYDDDAKHTSVE